MKNYNYIGIKNKIGILKKLKNMGYVECKNFVDKPHNKWVFIGLNERYHGELVDGAWFKITDIEINIDNIPLRKDFNEWIKMMDTGTKLGLL